jgi:predicted anti-sigma-YlaC factor YlaD
MSEFKNGCGKIHDLLEPYFEGVLPEAQERLVADHLWQCPRCAAELAQIQRLTVALDALPQVEPAQELLAAISARLATLPVPAARRVTAGWRRLGLAATISMALTVVALYGLGLIAPALLLGVKPSVIWLTTAVHHVFAWSDLWQRSWLALGIAARALFPALRAPAIAIAPIITGYAAAEVACLAAAAWVIRTSHRRATVPSQIGTRR